MVVEQCPQPPALSASLILNDPQSEQDELHGHPMKMVLQFAEDDHIKPGGSSIGTSASGKILESTPVHCKATVG
uniref:Uncharacterized protein n=1 Tax=Oryza punctata TaxID=4537 RepID=A0A0E0L122_ORYPU